MDSTPDEFLLEKIKAFMVAGTDQESTILKLLGKQRSVNDVVVALAIAFLRDRVERKQQAATDVAELAAAAAEMLAADHAVAESRAQAKAGGTSGPHPDVAKRAFRARAWLTRALIPFDGITPTA